MATKKAAVKKDKVTDTVFVVIAYNDEYGFDSASSENSFESAGWDLCDHASQDIIAKIEVPFNVAKKIKDNIKTIKVSTINVNV